MKKNCEPSSNGIRTAKPQEVKLTSGKLVRLKDNIGNTLGMMKLDKEGQLLIWSYQNLGQCISIPTRK